MVNAAMRATMTRIGFTIAGSQAIVNEQDISSLAEVHQYRVSRTVISADITLDSIRTVRE